MRSIIRTALTVRARVARHLAPDVTGRTVRLVATVLGLGALGYAWTVTSFVVSGEADMVVSYGATGSVFAILSMLAFFVAGAMDAVDPPARASWMRSVASIRHRRRTRRTARPGGVAATPEMTATVGSGPETSRGTVVPERLPGPRVEEAFDDPPQTSAPTRSSALTVTVVRRPHVPATGPATSTPADHRSEPRAEWSDETPTDRFAIVGKASDRQVSPGVDAPGDSPERDSRTSVRRAGSKASRARRPRRVAGRSTSDNG